MTFSRRVCEQIKYYVGNYRLENVLRFNDLGVLFDSRLDFGPHIEGCVNKAIGVLGFIKRWSKEFVDPYLTKRLFTTLVKHILDYVSPSYQFNVDQNYAPLPVNAEEGKGNRHLGILSPSEQQQPVLLFKEDRRKEDSHPNDSTKVLHQQQGTPSKQIKSESATKAENIKSEPVNNISSPMSHIPLNNKDLGSYSNVYSRHPVTLSSQQTSREEELRRYYIFNDQQRRQNSILSNNGSLNQQVQGNSPQTNQPQCRDDSPSTQGNVQTQQQIKIKSNASLGMLSNSGKITSTTKESPKHKQDEETKTIKQEGQKPTMETQGPPPPPTSQYFLHPSYIAPTPFGFDPNHPMYRNVLMPPTSPYNAAPYHLPMPRYHTPEDLSRNAGPKALDVLHHAASQYYTTHKIHELSERALKSPNNGSNNGSNTAKVSVSSPTLSTVHLPNMSTNSLGHHSNTTQSPQTITSNSNKQDVLGQKALCGPIVGTNVAHELQKPPSSSGSPIASNSAIVTASGSGADSRSPPPQRHVHTHHHTHVGLGYPMYPAPYGAAVLASQQAAAVAVINPFPPGPTK
ncbi:uncharacterized protein LOC142239791 [Haematobia irritans]|uniref:uncharacterized protein LOC142239791 n=1 Tax=Haematobia irritans TaxID=7368 RepID=UPI003F4FE94C